MQKKNIFTIQFEREQLENEIEQNGGEITEEQIEQIEINKDELEDKVERYLHVIKECELNASIITGQQEHHKAELKRLDLLKKPLDTKISNMKKTIDGALKFFGIDKMVFPIFKVGFRKSKETVITDVTLLPKSCFESKIKTKSAIKLLIESGDVKKGAEIIIKQNLQIK